MPLLGRSPPSTAEPERNSPSRPSPTALPRRGAPVLPVWARGPGGPDGPSRRPLSLPGRAVPGSGAAWLPPRWWPAA